MNGRNDDTAGRSDFDRAEGQGIEKEGVDMYYIGPHVSMGGGVANAPKNAKALGATGFEKKKKNGTSGESVGDG